MAQGFKALVINDWSGGWVTITGALSLSLNQVPDILNLIPLPGRLRYRGGYLNTATLPAAADHAIPFYDGNGGKHYAVWAGGSLYDYISGSSSLVEAAVYTAGSQIGACSLGGKLYWACGDPSHPVRLRYWDGGLGKGAVASAGGAGIANPPASSFLFVYLNSIVALAPYWGAPLVADRAQLNVMCWCDVNDPTKWNAASSQAVGPTDGGSVVFGGQFGISSDGVAPLRDIVVMRGDRNVYCYNGALGSLQENMLNCTTGCIDCDSVQWIPQMDGLGAFVFLGRDGQIWKTNGINAEPISMNISDWLFSAVTATLEANPLARFRSCYNQDVQYYWLDVNGTQVVFRWKTTAWSKFQGWPSGPTFSTTGFTGAPVYYVASNNADNLHLCQVAVDGQKDNGAMPQCYFDTPYLHGGDIRLLKEFQWITMGFYDTGFEFSVQGKSNKRLDNSFMLTRVNVIDAPSDTTASSGFILGSSILGGTDVLSPTIPVSGGNPVIAQFVPICDIPADEWFDEGETESLKGGAAQFRVAWSGGNAAFDVLSMEFQYVPKGYMGAAGEKYNPTAGAGSGFDPWATPE